MRIIFVGLHNKPNMLPLCSSTKSGKLINRIISGLPKKDGVEIIKSNLFDVDYFPNYGDMNYLSDEWYCNHLPTNDDIIILLGAITHKQFNHKVKNLIKIAHPSSMWSNNKKNEYVSKTIEKITKLL